MQRKGQPARKRPAVRTSEEAEGTSPGDRRVAGTDAMADTESTWDIVAEASDQSFPCSDPPAWPAVRIGSKDDS